jgi:hypothetical protein
MMKRGERNGKMGKGNGEKGKGVKGKGRKGKRGLRGEREEIGGI